MGILKLFYYYSDCIKLPHPLAIDAKVVEQCYLGMVQIELSLLVPLLPQEMLNALLGLVKAEGSIQQ